MVGNKMWPNFSRELNCSIEIHWATELYGYNLIKYKPGLRNIAKLHIFSKAFQNYGTEHLKRFEGFNKLSFYDINGGPYL